MDQIIVVSKRYGGTKAPPGYSVVPVDRSSVLGNPFVMKSEAERDAVCEQYARWLPQAWNDDPRVYQTLEDLVLRARRGEKLALQCWCAPKRCHADTIKQVIEGALK